MVHLGGRPNFRRGGLIAVIAAIGFAAACGGTAIIDAPGGKAGGTSAAGAISVGGASSIAGSVSATAGSVSATAGSVSATAGSVSATAGSASATAGSGGLIPEACSATLDPGSCEAYIPSFWHDPTTGVCEPFVYGGCGGNTNRYPSREACQQACADVQDDGDVCVDDSDCTFANDGCCAPCEPVDIRQLIALNVAHAPQAGRCKFPTPCGLCMFVPENEQTRKYFKPKCQNAHCTLIDLRETPLTACEKTSDCMLRDGTGCCPECDGAGWVAVNKSADFCGGKPTPPCDPCISLPPKEWDAVCLSGRCFEEGPL